MVICAAWLISDVGQRKMNQFAPVSKRRVATFAIIAGVGVVVWRFLFPSAISDDFAELSWRRLEHSQGVVVISVRDSALRPLANVSVTSESHSGRAITSDVGYFTTNSSGIASLMPGEVEVIAVWIGSHRIPTFHLTNKFFGPDCSTGIVFEAILKKAPNQALQPTAATGRG